MKHWEEFITGLFDKQRVIVYDHIRGGPLDLERLQKLVYSLTGR